MLQNQEYDENHHVPELLIAQILKEYIGFVAGRIDLKTWVDSAVEKMTAVRRIETQSELYQLVQAHIYMLGDRIEEAKWILEITIIIVLPLVKTRSRIVIISF